jgi:hypothetical protein
MAGYGPESYGQHHHKNCSLYGVEKFSQLFYYEQGLDAWIPAPCDVRSILDLNYLDNSEIVNIQFKRIDMTDKEMDELPED